MNFDLLSDVQTVTRLQESFALLLSILASIWSFAKGRRARRLLAQAAGPHYSRGRWTLVAGLFAFAAIYFGAITSSSSVTCDRTEESIRMIGVVSSITHGEDGHAVARLRDLTGEIPVLFRGEPPRLREIIYVEGSVSVTEGSRIPYLVANQRRIGLTLSVPEEVPEESDLSASTRP
jgi:hypothetical protein